MGVRSGNAKNQAIYNSNNQKMVEPQLSTRNAPNHSHFAPGMSDQPSGQAILRDLPISNNLQKSGDIVHSKVDRQNSFALYGNKRAGATSFGHKLMAPQQNVQITGLKQRTFEGQAAGGNGNSAGDGFHAREPNETSLMKARPSTSIRLASKSHVFGSNSQHFASSAASQTLKFAQGRQVFNNRTVESANVGNGPQPGTVQMKGALARVGQQNGDATQHHAQ